MRDSGDICVVDLGGERRERALVLSGQRFHARSDRVLVAPAWWGPDQERLPPWRVRVDADVFAVDLMLTIKEAEILEHVGTAPYPAVMRARRALVSIT